MPRLAAGAFYLGQRIGRVGADNGGLAAARAFSQQYLLRSPRAKARSIARAPVVFAPLPTLPPLLQFAGIDEIPMRAVRMRDKVARWAATSRRTSDEA
jgi:hypothetical protein